MNDQVNTETDNLALLMEELAKEAPATEAPVEATQEPSVEETEQKLPL